MKGGSRRGKTTTTTLKQKICFPSVLHRMLQDASKEGNDHILCWTHNGKSFQINDYEKFETIILPRYGFKTRRFRSFQRQLSFYGFFRPNFKSHENFGSYRHPLFLKSNPRLCTQIINMRPKKTLLLLDDDDNNNNTKSTTFTPHQQQPQFQQPQPQFHQQLPPPPPPPPQQQQQQEKEEDSGADADAHAVISSSGFVLIRSSRSYADEIMDDLEPRPLLKIGGGGGGAADSSYGGGIVQGYYCDDEQQLMVDLLEPRKIEEMILNPLLLLK